MQNNPWADRWENQMGGWYGSGDEANMIRLEAAEARLRPTRTCQCGKESFSRPAVGGYWCEDRHLWEA